MLVVQNLSRKYNKDFAVDNISFQAESGQVTGLLGPNGCGKSTTLRMLAGAMKPTSGTYIFNGECGGVDSLQVKNQTGYIPDIGGVFPRLTGWEHMQLCARLFKLGSEKIWSTRAHELLERLEIANCTANLAGTYSHGMGRKLSSAVAMLPEPLLVLADEPFDGVDAAGVETITKLLQERADVGATVILSTHLLGVAHDLCSVTWNLDKGKIMPC